MDNYSLEEVKMLINKNLVTPEVFKNILNSTTRRLELYDDPDDLSILHYLATSELVPSEAKEEINKYLAIYDSYNIKNHDSIEESKEARKGSIILVISLVVCLFMILIFLFVGR